MFYKIKSFCTVLLCHFCVSLGNPTYSNMTAVQIYLSTYGYLSQLQKTKAEFAAELRQFQTMANIVPSGKLDALTMKMMRRPRCGNQDNQNISEGEQSAKILGYIQGTKWLKRHLTYKIIKYTDDVTNSHLNYIVETAFQIWSEAIPLTFTPTICNDVDIAISFEARSHGDGNPFDGPGGVLAHAFFPGDNKHPTNGDVHFDSEENWAPNSNSASDTPILSVLVHEIGHSLGLLHSQSANAIMWSWYSGRITLHDDDVRRITKLYGPAGSSYGTVYSTPPPAGCIPRGGRTVSSRRHPYTVDVTTTSSFPRTRTSTSPIPRNGLCSGKVDAFLLTSAEMYIFQGTKVYSRQTGLRGLNINLIFPGSPSTVDAAFSFVRSENTVDIYIIKGLWCWKYRQESASSFTLLPNFPSLVSRELRIRLSRIDAIHSVDGRNLYCVISGRRYMYIRFYHQSVLTTIPYSVKNHQVLSKIGAVMAAFRWMNGVRYYFVDGQYYKYDLSQDIPRLTGPRDTAKWWFGCG